MALFAHTSASVMRGKIPREIVTKMRHNCGHNQRFFLRFAQ